MNTNPDEAKLALWLEDELHGEEFAEVDAWAGKQQEHLAAREEIRKWRRMMASAIPASEEPPYSEFFNARIAREIRNAPLQEVPASKSGFSFKSFIMPLAACAGMALAFLLGLKSQGQPQVPEIDVAGAPKAIPVEPILYTPDRGVTAEWFSSPDASATVIVLNGVDAIPDETDFGKTVSMPEGGEINSTAESKSIEAEELGL